MLKPVKKIFWFWVMLFLIKASSAENPEMNFQDTGIDSQRAYVSKPTKNTSAAPTNVAANTQTNGLNSQNTENNPVSTKGGISFQNADIRAVIEAVAKLTGKNFIIDPRVKGLVTLVSPGDIDPEDLYDIFLSILKVHGYIAAEDDKTDLIRILPASEARVEASLGGDAAGSSDEVILKLIKINSTKAAELVPILRPLISKTGHLAAHTGSNNIIVTDTRHNVLKLEEIIHRMDLAAESNIKIVKLKNATATKLVALLTSILKKDARGAGGAASVSQSFNFVAEERTNSIVLRGTPEEIQIASELLDDLDSSESEQSGTAVIKLKYSQAKDIETIINKIIEGKGKNPFETDAKISIDEKNNSVVIYGSPKKVTEIKSIIEKIDVKRAQIMVEALIVEMSADKSTQLGIQWAAAYDNTSDTNPGGLSTAAALGAIIGTIKSGSHLTFGVIAQALADDADANLVSAPSILTLENEEAEIEIGQEVPFVTGSYTSTGNTTNPENPFTTISRENIGLKLKITPQINADNTIKLAIEQEISTVLPGAQAAIGAADVVTGKRLIKTQATIRNGHMLVLGGLIDDNVRESENRTPGLSKIPLLGYLFRSRGTTKQKRNLMIFIRPYIVNDNRAETLLTKNRYDNVRNLQLDKLRKGVILMPNEQQPLIKDVYGTDAYRKPKTTRVYNYNNDVRTFQQNRGENYYGTDTYRKPKTTRVYKNRVRPFRQNKGKNYDVLNPDYGG